MSLGQDDVDSAALERALAETPRGAAALAGVALGLLLLAWFVIYLLIFLARGPVS
jgi:hypothetical protein